MTEEQWNEDRQALLNSIGYIDIDEEGTSVNIDGWCSAEDLKRIILLMKWRVEIESSNLC